MWSRLPSVFSLQNILLKGNSNCFMQLQVLATLKTDVNPSWRRKIGVRELDVSPARVPIHLSYKDNTEDHMSAFSPTPQSLFSKTITNRFYGS